MAKRLQLFIRRLPDIYPTAIEKFATVGRILNSELCGLDNVAAAKQCCEEIDKFLQRIGLWIGYSELGVSMEDIREISDCGQVLGDYLNNPRVATIDEMYELLISCYQR
ncbi:MAG: iron-containing alcohol dehydrogenase [[Clostridium] leptum]